MTLRTQIFTLTDQLGNILTDGTNQLIANIQISDFGLTANASEIILHGHRTAWEVNTGSLTYTLTDGTNTLTDGTNTLIAKVSVEIPFLHAGPTENIVHGG